MIINSSPELLMPAGNFEKMQVAFNYGADAVYAGVPIFSLRIRENEFNKERLIKALKYARQLGKKIYLTMNIYAHNSKVSKFLDSFCEMSELNPDAFIMVDPGLINECLKLRPQTIIHLSTQANVTNWTAVAFWRDCGIKRIILPRELSITEIAEIHQKVPDLELEAFVHGAICVAYSGRCLLSNYLTHRDANQGACANTCRWEYKLAVEEESLKDYELKRAKEQLNSTANIPYHPLQANYYLNVYSAEEQRFLEGRLNIDEDEHGTYLMNSKDLCAIELLKELQAAGVCSFKIEGRNKSTYYTGVVARAYRRAIDDMLVGKSFNKENLQDLIGTQNRTLMTGFLTKRPEEYGQNYTDGASTALTYRFAGIVRKVEDNIAWVEVKNKLELGDTLEWIFKNQTVTCKITFILNAKGETVIAAHGGIIWGLNLPEHTEIPELTLIRQKL
ncbi:MAG: U32 family peptidase C-terminal domain-containing protein [Deltaproteobacteria bacterium]|jgi:putative protease|nr:U32 family peptidase C-terminal domain-containing protein [Deltaproteobacteria bacterium]